MKRIWQLKNGDTAVLDDDQINPKFLVGTVYGKYGEFRMLWDSRTHQAWGPDMFDLDKEIGNASLRSE